jgi:hypothetical protein
MVWKNLLRVAILAWGPMTLSGCLAGPNDGEGVGIAGSDSQAVSDQSVQPNALSATPAEDAPPAAPSQASASGAGARSAERVDGSAVVAGCTTYARRWANYSCCGTTLLRVYQRRQICIYGSWYWENVYQCLPYDRNNICL